MHRCNHREGQRHRVGGRARPAAIRLQDPEGVQPPGTGVKLKRSVTPIGSDTVAEPVTSRTIPLGAPPPNVFFHDRSSVELLTRPVRLLGADGVTGTLTKSGASFETALVSDPSCPRMRINQEPVGATIV